MAGAAEVMMHAWKEWSIQALVLLSLTLQVMLLVLAEFRRRVDSGVVRFFAWSAYMLADGTAIYVLGHLSAASRSAEHELMAFWAPFLLLHLGGQDNMTAYAIEDNRLWLRHLQTLAVQVTAAGYVLLRASSIVVGSQHRPLLRWASILMFVVGVVKYGARVWALRCAGSSPVGKNYQELEHSAVGGNRDKIPCIIDERRWDTQDCLVMAHEMLGVPKELIKGIVNEASYRFASYLLKDDGRILYKVAQMQMSLMHDVLYTKVEVMHGSLYGLCIHLLSPVATTIAFLLFHLQQQQQNGLGSYSLVDVAVTYVLLVGALVLEAVSASRAIFSSWACALLVSLGPTYSRRETLRYIPSSARPLAPCSPSWWLAAAAWELRHSSESLGRMVSSLRRLVRVADWARYWSASMGQHNLLQMVACSRASKSSRIAKRMGREVWWNAMAYSCSIPVRASIQKLLVTHIMSKGRELRRHPNPSSQFDSRGKEELQTLGLCEGLDWSVEDKILVWHIATNIYIYSMMSSSEEQEHEHERVSHLAKAVCITSCCSGRNKPPAVDHHLAEAVEDLSNYMVYLLASRPYMLGPTASHNSYIEVCFGLISQYNSTKDLAIFLRRYGDTERGDRWQLLHFDHTTQHHLVSILDKGCELGAKLVSKEEEAAGSTLEVIAQVWVETLCYASQRCSPQSHAKHLSNGGELITLAAILVEYFKHGNIDLPPTREEEEFYKRQGFNVPVTIEDQDEEEEEEGRHVRRGHGSERPLNTEHG